MSKTKDTAGATQKVAPAPNTTEPQVPVEPQAQTEPQAPTESQAPVKDESAIVESVEKKEDVAIAEIAWLDTEKVQAVIETVKDEYPDLKKFYVTPDAMAFEKEDDARNHSRHEYALIEV